MAPTLPAVTGADNELIDRFILLLRDPPITDAGVAWTSDVFLGLIQRLDLWEVQNWYHPEHEPVLALDQFRAWLLGVCRQPDPVEEDALVTGLLGEVSAIVGEWASARADESFGGNRDMATRALASEEELRKLLASFKRSTPHLYGNMTEEEFAAELRRQVHDAPYMRPRSVELSAALLRLDDGWRSAREATLAPWVIADWKGRRTG